MLSRMFPLLSQPCALILILGFMFIDFDGSFCSICLFQTVYLLDTFKSNHNSNNTSTKVIYPKYSKHWLSTVAHTIDCVWSKILNHGLNHGLLFSLFKFFGWKNILNLLENSMDFYNYHSIELE